MGWLSAVDDRREPLEASGHRRRGSQGPLVITNTMTSTPMYYPAIVNEEAGSIVMTRFGATPDQPPLATLHFTELEPDLIVLEGELLIPIDGKFGKHQLKVTLRHLGDDKFLLKNRGFHWINEMPYNRYGPRHQPPPQLPPPPKRPD